MNARSLNRAQACILCGCIAAASQAATLVTIVDDDTASAEAVSRVRAVAEANGVKATFAAIARNAERDPALAAQLLDCQSAGHEIASHSYSHSPAVWSRRQSRADQVAEMEQDLVRGHAVLTNLGLRISAFVYPYGNFKGREYRSAILAMAASHYPVAFDSRGGDNRPGRTHFLYVGRLPMRSHNSRSAVEGFLRSAACKGDGWLVLMTHGGKRSFDAEGLDAAIKVCKASGCVFATASEAAEMLRARGWRSVPDEDTGEVSLLGELVGFARFHLPHVVVALFALALLAASIAAKRAGRGLKAASGCLAGALPPASPERKDVDAGSALARIVAVTCVVLLHMRSYFLAGSQGMQSRQALDAMFACCFWAVPAFVVLSGYHTLPALAKTGVDRRYGKRFARLAAKTLFWGAIFSLAGAVMGGGSTSGLLSDWLRCRPFFHLWFLFMLLGLYALAPLLRMALANAGAATCVFAAQVAVMANPTMFDSPFWQYPVAISLPYAAMFLAGGLLSRVKVDLRLGAASLASAILYFAAVAYASTCGGRLAGFPACHYLGFFGLWGGVSVVVLSLYAGSLLPKPAGMRLFRASKLVFGVYVVHPLVMTAALKAFPQACPADVFGILSWCAAVCAASAVLVSFMLRVPVLKRFL